MAVRTIFIRATRNKSVSTVVINRGPAGADGTGGTSTIAEAEDVATVDLPTLNEPLSDALAALVGSVGEKAAQSALDALAASVSNVDNTSDANKPVSTATQAALDLKAAQTALDALAATVSNVDNTSDADKPVSTATQAALDLKANSADLGTAAARQADQDLQTTDAVVFDSVNATGTVTSVNGYFDAPVVNNSFTLWVGSLGNRNFTVNGFGNVESKTILPRAADVFSLGSDLRAWKDVTASGTVTGGTIKTGVYTVATLPSGVPGMRATVSDSDKHPQGNFGNTVVAAAGGTSYVVPVFFDGSNWIIA